MMDVRLPDGTLVRNVPDGTTRAQLMAKLGRQAAPSGKPSFMDSLRTNPVVGAPLQTLLQAGQGAEQLLAHGAATVSDLGGLAPNPVSRTLRGVAGKVDEAISGQRKGYDESKRRVVGASTNPRAMHAAVNTGEVMGNMLNPAGMAGSAVPAAPGVVNAALRGGASGAGFGASQPVSGEGNFWGKKAAQVGTGAAMGGATGAVSGALGGEKLRPPRGPTTKQLKLATDEAYEQARESGTVIPKKDFAAAVDDIEKSARAKLTFRPALQPKSATALKQIREELDEAGGGIGFNDIEVARRIALTSLESKDKSDRAVGHFIIDKIDDFAGSVGGSEFAAARGLYARSAKTATIERLKERAKNAVGANYTTAGYQTALRQQFKALANNENAIRRFSKEEQAAILKVVRGGPVENVLRDVGRFAPRGVMTGMGYTLGLTQSPEIAIPLAGATLAARGASTGLAGRNATMAEELMRGPPLAPLPGPAPNAPVRDPAMALMIQLLSQPRGQ